MIVRMRLFICAFIVVFSTQAFADDCFSATLGAEYEVGDTVRDRFTPFLLGRVQCEQLTLKFRVSSEEGAYNFDLQEAFFNANLSNSTSLTFGKAIVAYDKSQFFRPLDVVQSDRLNFDIRDNSGRLAGLPLASLVHFGEKATTRLVVSRDFENEPDGANLGLEQLVLSREALAGSFDYALTFRYASGARETLSFGASATVPINDFMLLYGSLALQKNVRRLDKVFAMSVNGNLQDANQTWFPQAALGVIINPPFDPSLSVTFEAFHDGTGLNSTEWDAVGRGFGPFPYLRQNYVAVSAQRSFGPVDGLLSAIHSVDDGSTILRAGAKYKRNRLSVDVELDRSFGDASDEFNTTGTSGFLEIRIDL